MTNNEHINEEEARAHAYYSGKMMAETKLTEFQQQLMDAAEEWATEMMEYGLSAQKPQIVSDGLYPEYVHEAKAAFCALVERAVDRENVCDPCAKNR